jgi:hypothetical protein
MGVELVLGPLFLVLGVGIVVMLISTANSPSAPGVGQWIVLSAVTLLLLLLGAVLTLLGVGKWRRVSFLTDHGKPLTGRVVKIEGTTMRVGPIPVYKLTLELAGPSGPYQAEVQKTLHAHEAAAIVGQELRVLVHPKNPTDLILNEEAQV